MSPEISRDNENFVQKNRMRVSVGKNWKNMLQSLSQARVCTINYFTYN